MTVAMPAMGEGVFLSATNGGPKPIVAAFMAHLIYGVLLGSISGVLRKE